MHQPRPHGTFGTDGDEDAAALELLARRLTNIKTLSGVDSLRMVRTLPSGAMALATDAGGIFKVIVQPRLHEGVAPENESGLAGAYIPMLFSGVVKKSVVRGQEGVGIELTKTTQRRLTSYGAGAKTPPARVDLQRFVIEHHQRASELAPKFPSESLWTQYTNQRPTWYSGAMAEVVQIVGGYGRQDFDELPENDIERAHLQLPEGVMIEIGVQLGWSLLPGYTGLPEKTGKFLYDYKYAETNGVSFDSNGKPWLLRVSASGVYAMPLPIVPATTTAAFREYMEEVGDEEILWILNRFGGMPSGESFPILTKDFEAWRRAGVIIKVCGHGGFYGHIAYSSAMGWTFNTNGSEGFNTCYDYESDGVGVGFAFKLSLSLGPVQDVEREQGNYELEDPAEMQWVNAYMSALYRQLNDGSARSRAIKYKLSRVSASVVLTRAKTNSGGDDAEYWDNFEAPPIAQHNGGIALVGEGALYHPAKPKFQPQIKFPEPLLDGCISHDFSPQAINSVPPGYIALCDTIMFGYYVEDSLKVVKYFLDSRNPMRGVEDNYEECMVVGAWARTETMGDVSLMGHFYTSDLDERAAGAYRTVETKITGTPLGYDSTPRFEFDAGFAMYGTLSRSRYFQHFTTSSDTEGYTKTLSMCVPYLSRNAVFHAKKESTSGTTKSEGLAVYAVKDPNSYRFFTYDFVWAWQATYSGRGGNMASVDKVSPHPIDGDPVWVTGYNYYPGGCSDFADQGGWISGLPADYTWLIHPNKGEWLNSGGGGPPTVREHSRSTKEPGKSSGLLQLSITYQFAEVNKAPSEGYFTMSPSEEGGVFYVDAIKNTAGDAVYANTSELDPDAVSRRKRWGFTRMADHASHHHFIGVINE